VTSILMPSRRRAEQQARRQKARSLEREKRIDELVRDEEATWSRIDAMIATRKPSEYAAPGKPGRRGQSIAKRRAALSWHTARSHGSPRSNRVRPSSASR
jgi:hypothetical protein